MKRRYLVLGMVAAALRGKPQAADTSYQKREIPKTDIELLYSMYNQSGDHSAITGGIGTEKLEVYAPELNLSFNHAKSTFSINAGTDVISSASTDRIDDVVSSASKRDVRYHTDIMYLRKIGKNQTEVGVGTGVSFESDYLSLPARAFVSHSTPSGLRKYNLAFSAYFDDLRWGRRADQSYKTPLQLIYPAELRYKEWYDVHNRYTFNVKAGIEQVINKRLVAAVYPEMTLQKGLLATPFHRVYFTNDSLKVENLPKQRIRVPIGLKVNWFAGSRTIIKAGYGFYRDNFGITANNFDLETGIKISPVVTLSPFVNVYRQSPARYFRPYHEHAPDAIYYSSDYDLSGFTSYRVGVGFRWAPFRYLAARGIFDEVQIRYAFFKRSDRLHAHMLSASFKFTREKKQNPNLNRN
ncbi:MAG: DUF3570 domain-containing protein [Bacteroidales bacterium]|nr:DUF3570 domain-containing protein [Bacteroidales bacterium]